MLVHECMECHSLSINRIAADDDADSILGVFQDSFMHGYQLRERCEQQGIEILEAEETEKVYEQLYGQIAGVSI